MSGGSGGDSVVSQEVRTRLDSLHQARHFLSVNCPLLNSQIVAEFAASPGDNENNKDAVKNEQLWSDEQPGEGSSSSNASSLRSAICARIIGKNEPCYVCLECAKDETTALCRQCFENSDHVNHDYNVGISSGNGSCDCGDSDAWTGCTGCHFHTGVDSHTIDEVRRMFSQEAFQKIVTHELPILFDNLGRDLRLSEDFFIPDDSTDQFYLILLNNEIHDIRTVKDILSLKMTHVQAAQCALLVDSYGCFKVLEGSIVECRSFAKIIASQSELHDSNICLRTLIVQKQKYLNFLRANNCLELLTILDDRMRFLLSASLLSLYNDIDQSEHSLNFLRFYVENESKLIQSTRVAFIKLFCDFCLRFISLRQEFALFFDQNYGQLLDNCKEVHESQHTFMIVMELQIYTAECIVLDLLERSNCLMKFLVLGMLSSPDTSEYLSSNQHQTNLMRMRILKYSLPFTSLNFFLSSLTTKNMTHSHTLRILIAFANFVQFIDSPSAGTSHFDLHSLNTMDDGRSLLFRRIKLLSLIKKFQKLLSIDQNIMFFAIQIILFHINTQDNFSDLDKFVDPKTLDADFEFSYKAPLYPLRLTVLSNFLNAYFDKAGNTDSYFDILTKAPDVSQFSGFDDNLDDLLEKIYPNGNLCFDSTIMDRIFTETCLVSIFFNLINNMAINNRQLADSHFVSVIKNQMIECARLDLVQFLISVQEDPIRQFQMIEYIRDIYTFYIRRNDSLQKLVDYCMIQYITQLLYSRNTIDNYELKSKEKKVQAITNYSLIKDFNLGSIMSILEINKQADKELFQEMTHIRFMRSGTYIHLKAEYMKYYNLFRAAWPTYWIESTFDELLKSAINSNYLFIPIKPEEPRFDYHKGFFTNRDVHNLIFNIYSKYNFSGYFGMIAITHIMNAVQEFDIFEHSPYSEEKITAQKKNDDSKLSFLKKSYEFLKVNNFDSQQANLKLETMLKSGSGSDLKNKESNTKEGESSNLQSSTTRRNKMKKIEEMQKAFQQNNQELFELINDEDSQEDGSGLDESPNNTIFDLRSQYSKNERIDECLSCRESFATDNPIITTLIYVSSPSVTEPLFRKIPLTCGHPIHRNCNEFKSNCLFCPMPFSNVEMQFITLDYAAEAFDVHQLPALLSEFANFICWTIKCNEMKGYTKLNFFNKYKFAAYHYYFRNRLIDPLIKCVDLNKVVISRLLKEFDNFAHSNILKMMFLFVLSFKSPEYLQRFVTILSEILDYSISLSESIPEAYSFFIKFQIAVLAIGNCYDISEYPKDLSDANKYHIDLLLNSKWYAGSQMMDPDENLLNYSYIVSETLDTIPDFVHKIALQLSENLSSFKIPIPEENFIDLITKVGSDLCPNLKIPMNKLYCFNCGKFICHPGICCLRSDHNDQRDLNYINLYDDNFINHSTSDSIGMSLTTGLVVIYSEYFNRSVTVNSLNPYVDKFSSTHEAFGKAKLDLELLKKIELIIFERRAVEYVQN